MTNTQGFGALQDKLDSRDFILKDMIVGTPDIPKVFSLRDKQSPIKAQGARGTCTSFAGTSILEYFDYIENGDHIDLSEEYLFKRTKEFDVADYGYDGYGAYLRSACKAMTKYGTVFEETLPYRSQLSESSWKDLELNESMDSIAKVFQTASYAQVEPLSNMIQHALLATDAPILTGINLYTNYTTARTTGVLPEPKGDVVAGHAMTIVGWNLNGWIMKNSWGESWGDNGYLLVPFYHRLYPSWSFIDADNRHLTEEGRLKIQLAKASEWAKITFKKAQDKGIATPDTDPSDVLTKEGLMVFLDRLNLL